MRPKLKWCRSALAKFHRDEEGMEAVQAVVIVAIGALVLYFLKTVLWPRIQHWTLTDD